MAQLGKDSRDVQEIDGALALWMQGDLALQEHWFVHVADPSKALTSESGQAEGVLQSITSSDAEGLVIVSQSCDVVRPCIRRPFVEVAPLVKVDPMHLNEIKRCLRPAYAFIPAVADALLVADLDRIMTVEKSVVSRWERTRGCRTDMEARDFAQALARKRARFAFPDDFTEITSRLQARIREKHDKQTEEGMALRALREIRVRAAPSWNAAAVELFFWFVREETEANGGTQPWSSFLDKWLNLLPVGGRFANVDGTVVLLEDLTAKDYVESDPLDLDHLSSREKLSA